MADVFELELHDLQEDDPNRAPDSDDDIIEVDEVNILYFIHNVTQLLFWTILFEICSVCVPKCACKKRFILQQKVDHN